MSNQNVTFRSLLPSWISSGPLLALLLLAGSPAFIFAQYSKQSPAQRLYQLIEENKSLRFQLIQERDPYQLRTQRRSPEPKHASLFLHKNHTFTESSTGMQQQGRWELDHKHAHLTIHYEDKNQRSRGQQASPHALRFEIKSFHNYRLVLEWQGRHGMVERTYMLDRRKNHSTVSKQDPDLRAMKQEIEGVKGQVKGVQGQVQEVKGQMKEVKGQIGDVSGQFRTLMTQIKEVRETN
ncbi:MAG: hypothetical protein AAF587_36710 [Bacteroidota bacterium]